MCSVGSIEDCFILNQSKRTLNSFIFMVLAETNENGKWQQHYFLNSCSPHPHHRIGDAQLSQRRRNTLGDNNGRPHSPSPCTNMQV
mmetsp:Transcript_28879/g.61295  ORF Transcript_28879/g.61295 Transcript_28879/m.61295 type:complete len:86 (-) Transcript_28879:841-1098(-)